MLINYHRIWMNYHYQLNSAECRSPFLELLKSVKGCVFTKYIFSCDMDKVDLAYFISWPRQDYIKLMSAILQQYEGSVGQIVLNKKFRLNMSNIWQFFKNIREIKTIQDNFSEKISGKEKLCIYMRTIVLDEILKIVKSRVKCNSFLVLCDVWPQENALIEFFQSQGVTTVSLQHALYVEDMDKGKTDTLNFIDVPSTYQLAWGESTKKLIIKYGNSVESIICGNPLIKEGRLLKEKNDKIIGIVFDHGKYREENNKMLLLVEKFALEYGYNIKIRIHPTDKTEYYQINKEITAFDQQIDAAEFIIAHRSTMLITYMVEGKRVYRYRTNIQCIEIDKQLEFETVEQLAVCISMTKEYDFIREGKKHIAYTGEAAKEQYRIFFTNLAAEKNN